MPGVGVKSCVYQTVEHNRAVVVFFDNENKDQKKIKVVIFTILNFIKGKWKEKENKTTVLKLFHIFII